MKQIVILYVNLYFEDELQVQSQSGEPNTAVLSNPSLAKINRVFIQKVTPLLPKHILFCALSESVAKLTGEIQKAYPNPKSVQFHLQCWGASTSYILFVNELRAALPEFDFEDKGSQHDLDRIKSLNSKIQNRGLLKKLNQSLNSFYPTANEYQTLRLKMEFSQSARGVKTVASNTIKETDGVTSDQNTRYMVEPNVPVVLEPSLFCLVTRSKVKPILYAFNRFNQHGRYQGLLFSNQSSWLALFRAAHEKKYLSTNTETSNFEALTKAIAEFEQKLPLFLAIIQKKLNDYKGYIGFDFLYYLSPKQEIRFWGAHEINARLTYSYIAREWSRQTQPNGRFFYLPNISPSHNRSLEVELID